MIDTEYSFGEDSISSVYAEEKAMEQTVLQAAEDCRKYGRDAIQKKNHYEGLKHTLLVNMFSEEADPAFTKKRTVDQRQALYRTTYAAERMSWMLADREYEIAKEWLKACTSALNSIQTRSRLIQIDSHLS